MGMQHIQEADSHIMDPRINRACLHAGCGKVGPLVGIEGRGCTHAGPAAAACAPCQADGQHPMLTSRCAFSWSSLSCTSGRGSLQASCAGRCLLPSHDAPWDDSAAA